MTKKMIFCVLVSIGFVIFTFDTFIKNLNLDTKSAKEDE